jgi:adenosylmethionine---8-amino-7-oxononanoate aminotransferase
VANWKVLMPGALPSPHRIEACWRERLLPLGDLRHVRDVRIRGSIAAVELAVEGGYLADVGSRLRRICQDQGVLCRPLGNVLYALPPLLTSDDSLDRIAAAMRSAVSSV